MKKLKFIAPLSLGAFYLFNSEDYASAASLEPQTEATDENKNATIETTNIVVEETENTNLIPQARDDQAVAPVKETIDNKVSINDLGQIINRSNLGSIINLTLSSTEDFNALVNEQTNHPIEKQLEDDANAIDYLTIISTIYYSDAFKDFFYENPNQSIYQYVVDFQSQPAEVQTTLDTVSGGHRRAQAIINTVMANPDVYDNMILVDVDHSEYVGLPTSTILNDGYAYKLTFLYGSDMIIYYAGTAGDQEWVNNSLGIYDADTDSQTAALNYFDQQYGRYGEGRKVYTIGVSNGGTKAIYAALLRGDKIGHAYSIGGPGFSQAFTEKYAEQIEKYADKTTTLVTDEDFIHNVYPENVAKAEYHKGQAIWEGSNLFMVVFDRILGTHAPFGLLQIQADGTVKVSQETEQNPLPKMVGDFVSFAQHYLPQETVNAMSEQIQGLFVSAPDAYFNDVFTPVSFITGIANPRVLINRVQHWLPLWVDVFKSIGVYAELPQAQIDFHQMIRIIIGFWHMPLPSTNSYMEDVESLLSKVPNFSIADFFGETVQEEFFKLVWTLLIPAGGVFIFAMCYFVSVIMNFL